MPLSYLILYSFQYIAYRMCVNTRWSSDQLISLHKLSKRFLPRSVATLSHHSDHCLPSLCFRVKINIVHARNTSRACQIENGWSLHVQGINYRVSMQFLIERFSANHHRLLGADGLQR